MTRLIIFIVLGGLIITGQGTNNAFSTERTQAIIIKDIILKKREILKNNGKGELYIRAVDDFIKKYKENIKAIEALQERILVTKNQLGEVKKEQNIKLIIDYIEYKIELTALDFNNYTYSNTSLNIECGELGNINEFINNPETADANKELLCMGNAIISNCSSASIIINKEKINVYKNENICFINIDLPSSETRCEIIDTLNGNSIYNESLKTNAGQFFLGVLTETIFPGNQFVKNCSN